MTLDEAIKRYTDNAEYERTHGNLQGCLEFKQLAEWLKELKQTRWIPVSERLPDIHNYCMKYLVTDCHRHIHTSLFTESGGKGWWSHSDVVAWMPLPKPYKASPTGAESEEKMIIHYSPDMVCPYCGNDEFFIKQSYKGTCEYNMRFDLDDNVENGEMFEYTTFKTVSKYAYCNNCRKRLFNVSELPYDHI